MLLCILLLTHQVYAGFPVGRKHLLLVPTYSYYTARGYWDRNHNYTPYAGDNGKFTSSYFGLYGGYGITRKLDLVFNVPYTNQTSVQNGVSTSNNGLGDATVGLSYFFTRFESLTHFSITGSALIPMYTNPTVDKPFLGFQEYGTELKLGLAGSDKTNGKYLYYDLEAGARRFFGTEGPTQVFANFTGGVPIKKKWKVSATMGGIISSSNQDTFNPNNLTANRDFNYLRFTVAGGYSITKKVGLWANGFMDVMGSNIGRGRGFTVFMVIKI